MKQYLPITDVPVAARSRRRLVADAEGQVTGTEQFVPEPTDKSCRCWLFEAVGGKRVYINADTSPFIEFPEGTEMGSIVGWLSKINPRTGEVLYGGRDPKHRREVWARELQAWMIAGILLTVKAATWE